MGGFEPLHAVSVGLGLALIVFFAGLVYWGNRFKNLRRTTIIFYGILGGAAIVVAVALLNHSGGQPLAVQIVLRRRGDRRSLRAGRRDAGRPRAPGRHLGGVSGDRGAIMGLYSVFLAVGQIVGSLLGGVAAELRGIDGLLVRNDGSCSRSPSFRCRGLRAYEHVVGTTAAPERSRTRAPERARRAIVGSPYHLRQSAAGAEGRRVAEEGEPWARVAIVTDSAADLTPDGRTNAGITVVPLEVSLRRSSISGPAST